MERRSEPRRHCAPPFAGRDHAGGRVHRSRRNSVPPVQASGAPGTHPPGADLAAIQKGEAFLPQWKFYDEGPLHLVATGTLRHLKRLEGGNSDFDPRRFRPNILIDTGDDDSGFVEDRWLAGELRIGDTVRIGGMWPAIRCVMLTNAQEELRHDPAILRAAAQHHQAYVGVFAGPLAPGTIRLGDPVVLALGPTD